MSQYTFKCIGCENTKTILCENCRNKDFKGYINKKYNPPKVYLKCLNCSREVSSVNCLSQTELKRSGLDSILFSLVFSQCRTTNNMSLHPSRFKKRVKLNINYKIIGIILLMGIVMFFLTRN